MCPRTQLSGVTDDLPVVRYAVAGVVFGLAGGAGIAAGLTAIGARPSTVLAAAVLSVPALAVAVPLSAIARRVGSSPDDPEEVERRLAEGLGTSEALRDDAREGAERDPD